MSAKVYHTALLLAGCLAFASAQARDEQYAKAQLAIADVDGFSDGLALVGTYGMKLPQVHPQFSVEGEITTTISDPDTSVAGNTLEVSYYTLAAYAVYTHPVTDRVDLFGRGGLLYEDVSVDYYHPLLGKYSDSETDLGLSFGVGTNVALKENLDFTAALTIIESDINHLSAGVHFRF